MISIGGIPDLSKLGEIKKNSNGTPMKIVAYRNSGDIDVQFLKMKIAINSTVK